MSGSPVKNGSYVATSPTKTCGRRGSSLANAVVRCAANRLASQGIGALAQVYARHATVTNERGEHYRPRTWSEIDVVQWTARQLVALENRLSGRVLGEAAWLRDQFLGGIDRIVAARQRLTAPVVRRIAVRLVEHCHDHTGGDGRTHDRGEEPTPPRAPYREAAREQERP